MFCLALTVGIGLTNILMNQLRRLNKFIFWRLILMSLRRWKVYILLLFNSEIWTIIAARILIKKLLMASLKILNLIKKYFLTWVTKWRTWLTLPWILINWTYIFVNNINMRWDIDILRMYIAGMMILLLRRSIIIVLRRSVTSRVWLIWIHEFYNLN